MSSKNPQIFVTRLPRDFNEEELRKTFRKYGKIKEVTLKKGYGFVVSIFPILKPAERYGRVCDKSNHRERLPRVIFRRALLEEQYLTPGIRRL